MRYLTLNGNASNPPQLSLSTFNGLKRALRWFWLGSFIFCQLFCFHKDPSVGQHLLLELPWAPFQRTAAAQWTQSIGQCTIKVGRSVLWRVLGGTDEAGVNLQGLVSPPRHVSSISFFPSEHCSLSRRGLEIFCGCGEKIAAAVRKEEVEEVTRLWNQWGCGVIQSSFPFSLFSGGHLM